MRDIIVFSFLLLFSCNRENISENTKSIIKNPKDVHAIKTMLKAQQDCWNNGDIKGFMHGYWNSENLIFTSASHKPSYGWQNTFERYKNSYPTKESMGELKIKILNLKLKSKNTAVLKGKWELIREKDHPIGIFWLELEKFEKNWVITKDSTISLIN